MSPASGAGNAVEPSRESARSRVRINKRVPDIRAVEVPASISVRSNCNHVSELGGS